MGITWRSSGEAAWQRGERETLSLQGLQVSAWQGMWWSWCSILRFLPHMVVCSSVTWKGAFVNHLHFCFSDNLCSTPHICCMLLLCCRVVAGFAWTFIVKAVFLLLKVYLLYFADVKYYEGKCCSVFLFPQWQWQLTGLSCCNREVHSTSERPLAGPATENNPSSYRGRSRNVLFTM